MFVAAKCQRPMYHKGQGDENSPKNVRIGDVETGLTDKVFDLEVGVVVAEKFDGLALAPVRGRVQRGPAVDVLRVHVGTGLEQKVHNLSRKSSSC